MYGCCSGIDAPTAWDWLLLWQETSLYTEARRALQAVAEAELHRHLAHGLQLEVMLKLRGCMRHKPDGRGILHTLTDLVSLSRSVFCVQAACAKMLLGCHWHYNSVDFRVDDDLTVGF